MAETRESMNEMHERVRDLVADDLRKLDWPNVSVDEVTDEAIASFRHHQPKHTRICIDCGAVGWGGGYHYHGFGSGGDTCDIAEVLRLLREAGQVADERGELASRFEEAEQERHVLAEQSVLEHRAKVRSRAQLQDAEAVIGTVLDYGIALGVEAVGKRAAGFSAGETRSAMFAALSAYRSKHPATTNGTENGGQDGDD